jgi:hypothetical protein
MTTAFGGSTFSCILCWICPNAAPGAANKMAPNETIKVAQ